AGWRRLRIALGRVAETGDDELGRAWYSANLAHRAEAPAYSRAACAGDYQAIVSALYSERHVRTAVHMIASAIGARPGSRVARWCGNAGWWWLRRGTPGHVPEAVGAVA